MDTNKSCPLDANFEFGSLTDTNEYSITHLKDFSNSLKNFKEFQGFLEIPWKILKVFKCSTLDLILTHLENVTLILALKFEVFRGQFEIALEVFKVPSPLKTLEMCKKDYPWPWQNLEFWGRGRGSLTYKATVANTNPSSKGCFLLTKSKFIRYFTLDGHCGHGCLEVW